MGTARQTTESGPRPARAVVVAGSVVAVLVVAATVAGTFRWTDDAFPVAPFRMFSYANDPNGVVRSMRFTADLASGATVDLEAPEVGLRRAELEEQTPTNRRVPDARMAEIVAVYNDRHDDGIVHLQVVVRRVPLVDGVPQAATESVIGDWASPSWTGERAVVDLPEAGPWRGYGS